MKASGERAVHPWVLGKVRNGLPLVAALSKQRFPALDALCTASAATVGADFYLLFLPTLFWVPPHPVSGAHAHGALRGSAMTQRSCCKARTCAPL